MPHCSQGLQPCACDLGSARPALAYGLGFGVKGLGFRVKVPLRVRGIGWVLPPRCDSWTIFVTSLYLALNMTPSICIYYTLLQGGGSIQGIGLRV